MRVRKDWRLSRGSGAGHERREHRAAPVTRAPNPPSEERPLRIVRPKCGNEGVRLCLDCRKGAPTVRPGGREHSFAAPVRDDDEHRAIGT